MSAMKKRKGHVSKKEVRLTIPSTNGLGENSGPIPTDLIFEILSRLPAKSITRFRCVSKGWAIILCRQDFTDLFLKMSSTRPRLLLTFQTDGKWSFFSSPQSMVSDQNSLLVVDKHQHVPKDYSFGVCSPVCGLVCTTDEWILSESKGARMMICNPSTGVSKPLPKVRTRRPGRVITFIGYDPIEKQCKVLCMTFCGKPKYKVEQHQVLTLGTKKSKWRMIECTVSHFPYNKEICINGVLYYLALETDGDLGTSIIVCFDVRSEKFNFITNKDLKDLRVLSTILINYKGKLGAVCPDDWGTDDGRATRLEVWVIDNIQEHKWSKHIHILPPLWKNLVANTHVYIAGVIGTTEVVFAPYVLSNPFNIFHLNMEKNSLTRVEIQGIGPLQGQNIYTFLNHVENLKSLL